MEDLEVVEGFEASGDLDEYVPDLILLEIFLLLLILNNLLIQIAPISKLHNNTKITPEIPQILAFQKGLLI